jgi:hypothetical protein
MASVLFNSPTAAELYSKGIGRAGKAQGPQ